MNEFNELMVSLNRENISCSSTDWIEDIPEVLYNKYLTDYKLIESGINESKNKWHSTAVDVIEIFGRFLGVEYVNNIYSEQMGVSDTFEIYRFFEMEEVIDTKYVEKK